MTNAAMEQDETPQPAKAVLSDIVGGRPEALSIALCASSIWRAGRCHRGAAAHVSATFVSVPDIMTAPHNPLAYVWWFFTPYIFAHEAVIIFFVLSGFLVGGAVLGRRTQKSRGCAIMRSIASCAFTSSSCR